MMIASSIIHRKKVALTARPGWVGVVALFVLLAAIALGLGSQQARAESEPPAALVKPPPHGVVVDADGLPVADCLLWLRYEADSHFLNYRSKTVGIAKSDAQGRFRFKESMRFATLHGSFETERFTVLARKEGVGVGWEWIAGVDPDGTPLTVALEAVHPLEVRVLDAARKPIQGATVWLAMLNPPTQDALMSVTRPTGWVESITNAEGKAMIAVPETTWAVAAMGPESEVVYHSMWAYPTRVAGRLQIPQLLEFTLGVASQIGGVVVDDQGKPVANLPVLIERADNTGSYSEDHQRQVTDAEGRFHIRDLRAYRRNGASGWRVWATGADWTSHPLAIPLRPGEKRLDLRIDAVRGSLVRGVTKDPSSKLPVAGARIWVLPRRDGKMAASTHIFTDEEGRFSMRVPPDTTTHFSLINLPAGWCSVGFGFGRSWNVQGKEPEEEITLHATEALRRLVKVQGGVEPPLPDVRVNASPAPTPGQRSNRLEGTSRDRYLYGFAPSATTDAKGRFEAPEWPSRTPLLVFCRTKDRSRAGWRKVETGDGLSIPEPIRLHETAAVRIRVTDAAGKPVSSRSLDVFPLADGVWLASDPNVTTDDQGIAVLKGVLPGLTYQIRDSNEISRRSHLVLLKEKSADSDMPTVDFSLLRPAEEPLTVQLRDADGAPVALEGIDYVNFEIAPPPGKIRGGYRQMYSKVKITGSKPDGGLILGSSERIDSPDVAVPFELRGTQADGTIVMAKGTLEPGSRHVLLILDQLWPMTRPPRVELDGVAPDEIAGRVVDPSGGAVSGADVTMLSWSGMDLGRVTTEADGVFRGKLDLGTENGKRVVYSKDPTRSKKWKDDRMGWSEWDETKPPFEMVRVEKEGFATAWIPNGKAGEPFEVKLDNTTRLKGVFMGPDGKPLRDVAAVIITKRGSFRVWENRSSSSLPLTRDLTLVRKSADGSYDWLLETGNYVIELRSADGMCARAAFLMKQGVTQAIPATFAPGRDLRIRVVDTAGKPLGGVTIKRVEYDGGDFAILGATPSDQVTDADGWAQWKGLPPWKGWFFMEGVKLKRCVDDINFLLTELPVAEAPLGEHPTDRTDNIRIDLTKIRETTVRAQRE
jgi:hypothetical protein